MAREIERKFLVVGDGWRGAPGEPVRQGYLSTDRERVVRVRTMGQRGMLTVKGISRGITRSEFEYEIPFADASEMLDELCKKPLIEKTRYRVISGGLTWEVDRFCGLNEGLVLAEVELSQEDQELVLPDWVGEEVSGDLRYFNSNLASCPYGTWDGQGEQGG